MRPMPWSGPQGARSFAEHRRPLAKLHVSPALRLRAWRADGRVEPPDGTGGEQPRPERYAGDCSLSCFTRPVTQLSICQSEPAVKDEPAEAAPKPIPSVARDASYLTRSAVNFDHCHSLPVSASRMVAVGTRIFPRPPHRSRRALLTHRAPPSGQTSCEERFSHALARRAAIIRIDAVFRRSVRTAAA